VTQVPTPEQTVQPLLSDLDRALAAADQVVAGIRDDQWPEATPNTDWDVRATVNHLTVGNLLFVSFVQRSDPIDRTLDYLGDDPVEAHRASARALRAAFGRPGVLEETFTGPVVPATGARLVHMRINEALVHGWDLARATGQPTDGLPADLAEQALALWQPVLGDRPRTGTPFSDPQPAPPGAPAIDRLAAYLGRGL
jgi:uncharacterized protein (TIGR03086 family)